MRVFPAELFIMRLKGTLPPGRQYDWARSKTARECLEGLRKLSGLDLGTEPEAWERWWAEEKQRRDIDPDF
jgi:hypothetical protein